jgi:acyl-CoA thioesterase II
MAAVESAWGRYPGYRVDLVPWRGRGRVRLGGRVLAESDACLIVKESDHAPQLYFPEASVAWEHFRATDHHTVCPFKGEADYWTLAASDPPLENVVWAYRKPFEEVAGLAGYVAFYTDRLEVELVEAFPSDPGPEVAYRVPHWGDAADLLRLLDVTPAGDGRFTSPPYPEPPLGTFFPQLVKKQQPRLVVEGGQLLGEAIVAASKTVPGQRVTSASMIFSRAARFDAAHEIAVDVLRGGRGFSTLETRTTQAGKLCGVGILLLDASAPDTIRGAVAPPDVPPPEACPHLDMGVTGRELRTVDDAYRRQLEVGPPEIFTWARFRDAPAHDYLHAALLAQSTTHWSIAAAMRPHEGVSEAQAHVTLSTGILAATIAFHDAVDVSEWLLYANPAIYAGRGLVQGEGHVFTRQGRLVASYTVQAMVREFRTPPDAMGKDYTDAM